MNKTYENYKKACEDVVFEFVETYFCDEEIKYEDVEIHFVGGDCDDVVMINDYFFNVSDMAEFIKQDASEKYVFDWYDSDRTINVKSWMRGLRKI